MPQWVDNPSPSCTQINSASRYPLNLTGAYVDSVVDSSGAATADSVTRLVKWMYAFDTGNSLAWPGKGAWEACLLAALL